jgi:Fe-S cluster biogenesis protein NfuA
MNNTQHKLHERVSESIDKLKPYLQADGGDIILKEITDDNVVKVQLTGACGGCPFRQHTLKSGVEQALKKEIPEIKSVESID